MKLNHLNLAVTNVPEAHQFLEKYFGLKDGSGNNNIAFLYDDNGLVLTLTSMKLGGETEVKYPVTFHIGFIQDSEQQVDAVNRRLKEDGFDVPRRRDSTARGRSISRRQADSRSKCFADERS